MVVKSVVDDFNNIYEAKRGIKIEFIDQANIDEYLILGIENRIEQIIAVISAVQTQNNQQLFLETSPPNFSFHFPT